MKTTKLILIEGLPGSGKSTTAQLVHDQLQKIGAEPELFLEGNVDHPADFDSVSFLSHQEYKELGATFPEYQSLLESCTSMSEKGCFVMRHKLWNENVPEALSKTLEAKDIYELPLDIHMELIEQRWKEFRDQAMTEDKVYIFDCAFIQNPVTIGMIKYDAPKSVLLSYIHRLAEIIAPLNPILLYVNQQDIRHSFMRAIESRPQEWFEGFTQYYTSQAYGKKLGAMGLDGTLTILHDRNQLEAEIFEQLTIHKSSLDNSLFDLESYKAEISKILSEGTYSKQFS